MTAGMIFGETGLLAPTRKRSASVVARGNVTVLEMAIQENHLQENAGLREMLQRRRDEIAQKNYEREMINYHGSQSERKSDELIAKTISLLQAQTSRPVADAAALGGGSGSGSGSDNGVTPLSYVPKSLVHKINEMELRDQKTKLASISSISSPRRHHDFVLKKNVEKNVEKNKKVKGEEGEEEGEEEEKEEDGEEEEEEEDERTKMCITS